MTTESAVLVRLPGDDPTVVSLVRDVRAAAARARKAMPGERTDVVRVETLSSELERLAAAQLASARRDAVAIESTRFAGFGFIDRDNLHEQPPARRGLVAPWIAAGDVAVELRLPFGAGRTGHQVFGVQREPETSWKAPPGTPPKKATAERFRRQIASTLLPPSDPPAFIEPSGVSNSILTDTLREFVRMPGSRVDAPVRYQDGSLAAAFPLRSVPLRDSLPAFGRELRLALLSIRHTEMDVEVDGCWLRNFDISRPRPAAETDEVAFELSRSQLTTLTRRGPLLIRLYQTGLDPAVVGFYRAIVHQLLESPGSVGVVPMYFRHPPRDAVTSEPAGVQESAYFAEGKPWAM